MRHPFASVQYFRNSLSTGTLNWMPGKSDKERETEKIPPVPPLLHRYNSVAVAIPTSSKDVEVPPPRSRHLPLPALKLPPFRTTTPQTDSTSRASSVFVNVSAVDDRPFPSAIASSGCYVKHSSKVTLVLSGQVEEAIQPTYVNGSVIDGILAVPRPSGLLSIEIKVEGHVKLREVGGGGSFDAEIIDELLYSWDYLQNLPFPSKVSFRYVLPTHYTNRFSGERLRLPPTYEAHLQGIPGFQMVVDYAITVYLKHTRDMSEWWRKGSRMRVPFQYRDLTRPEKPGPFPSNLTKSPANPKTLFKSTLRSRRRSQSDLEVHLFLPSSRVCTVKEPISFFITVFGDSESLEPFTSYQPVASSFHPISESSSQGTLSISSFSNIQAQLKSRSTTPLPPIRIRLQRRTLVDIMMAETGNEAEHKLAATRILAHGTIHSLSKGTKSVTWSGTIVLPPTVQCGGFTASGMNVVDSIVLTITQPEAPRSRYMPFNESIPIRLTTETHDCYAALPVSDWES